MKQRVVIDIPRPKRRIVLLLIASVALLASAAIAHVWTHARVIDLGYKLSRASKLRAKLRERNRRLRVELAVLKNPKTIGKYARNVLGMREPEPEQLHRLTQPAAQRQSEAKANSDRGLKYAGFYLPVKTKQRRTSSSKTKNR